jgi:hypothetical protein
MVAFLLLPPGGQVKTKNPPPSGSGLMKISGTNQNPTAAPVSSASASSRFKF